MIKRERERETSIMYKKVFLKTNNVGIFLCFQTDQNSLYLITAVNLDI